MRPSRPWLPNLLREAADAWGLETALAFARRYGGRKLYLPRRANPEDPVVQVFGEEFVTWLIAQHRDLACIVVPTAKLATIAAEVALCRELREAGHTLNAIAEKTGLHYRTVERRLSAAAGNSKQLSLFP
jgi:hypothetical protein